ncbi:MAG TPA: hypothetical protein VKP11_09715 [Frankiaceae bacterium]|nr:hypothetical protein [Frankiaceae bacterium]
MIAHARRHRPTDTSQGHEPVTVGQLREVIDQLPDEIPLFVGVRDRHHFDTFLFDIPIVGMEVTHGPKNPVLVFDAAGVS